MANTVKKMSAKKAFHQKTPPLPLNKNKKAAASAPVPAPAATKEQALLDLIRGLSHQFDEGPGTEKILSLLDEGANPDTTYQGINYGSTFWLMRDWTPLMFAAHGGHVEVLTALLKKGASIEQTGANGETAVICALDSINNRAIECFALLACAGANTSHADKNGMTALMYAARRGSIGPVQTVVNFKADLDTQDKDGNTAIMHAAELYHTGAVITLAEAGANLDIANKSGKTLIDILKEHSAAPEVVECLGKVRDILKKQAERCLKNGLQLRKATTAPKKIRFS